jgi:DNA invertase Pin-like site-specific DNA recombinase
VRTYIYARSSFGDSGTEPELLHQFVEDRGDVVASSFSDDAAILGKGKNAGWHQMLSTLEDVDQIVLGCVADLPGRKVADLFKILDLLRNHGVSLRLDYEGIDTDDGAAAILDLITAYRSAKLSEAIRHGISNARREGKVIGRPAIPGNIRLLIETAVADGGGVRLTARRFGVSPGSVINIRRMIDVEPEKLAA